MSTERRLDRLEHHIQEHDLKATVIKVAAHTGISPHELMAEAQVIAERVQAIGYDVALEELALAAGTTATVLRAEADQLGMDIP